MVEICMLGTSGTLPLINRALSSLYIRVNGRGMLLDCGEGTQVSVRRLGWGFRCLDGLVITHFHGDHCTGLPGMLLSLEKAGREEPFDIYGPAGLRRVVEGLCVIVPKLSFPVRLHEYPPEGHAFELIGLQIRAFPVNHGVPCYGYRLVLPRQGAFDPEKARAMKVPLDRWKMLQAGDSVRLGLRKVHPEDVLGPPRKGICFVFSTDTRPCETLRKYTEGADLAILEGMYPEEEKYPLAVKNHHMLYREAAEIARDSGVKHLVLSHFSTSVEVPEEGLPAATDTFPETRCGQDGLILRLNYPKEQESAALTVYRKEDWYRLPEKMETAKPTNGENG